MTNSGVAESLPKTLSPCSTVHHVIISICTEAAKKSCLTEILCCICTQMAAFMLSLTSICISYSVYCKMDLEDAMSMDYFSPSF